MKKLFGKHAFEGEIEIGERTCDWSATAQLTMYDNRAADPQIREASKVELLEVEDFAFSVKILGDDGARFVGAYDDRDAPEAEVRYWEARITTEVKRKVARLGGADVDWQEAEAEEERA